MVQLIRSVIAFVVASILTVLTFGRVELNRTGTSTAGDDSEGERHALTQPLDDEPEPPKPRESRG